VKKPRPAASSTRSGLSSKQWTSAPPAASASAVAMPEPPRPKRASRLFAKERAGIIALPQLQGRKADQGEHDRDDPEADHHLALGPAKLLEMVVDRRHQEHAPAGHLEPGHLDDHRHELDHEQAADDGEHDLVLGRHGDA